MDIASLLAEMIERKASDLHLAVGVPPIFRVDGKLVPAKQPNLTSGDIEALLLTVLPEDILREARRGQARTRLLSQDSNTYCCQVFRGSGNLAAAIHYVTHRIPSLERLQLPAIIEKLSKTKRGVLLFVGPTGSGKSTTLVSFLEHINLSRSERIFTIEDSIHYALKSKLSLITQQIVGEDVESYAQGLEVIRRADPNVVMIGELRAAEPARLVLELAEAGQLVLAQMTAENLSEALERLASMLGKPYSLTQAMIARNVQAVIAQKLLWATPVCIDQTGQERVAATEILLSTPAVRQRLATGQMDMTDIIAAGSRYGMQAMDDSVMSHYNAGRISRETAAQNMKDIKRLLPTL